MLLIRCRAWPNTPTGRQPVYMPPAPFIPLSFYFLMFVPPQTTLISPSLCFCFLPKAAHSNLSIIPRCSSPVSHSKSHTFVGNNTPQVSKVGYILLMGFKHRQWAEHSPVIALGGPRSGHICGMDKDRSTKFAMCQMITLEAVLSYLGILMNCLY